MNSMDEQLYNFDFHFVSCCYPIPSLSRSLVFLEYCNCFKFSFLIQGLVISGADGGRRVGRESRTVICRLWLGTFDKCAGRISCCIPLLFFKRRKMQDPFFATTTGKRKRSKPAKSAPKTTKAVQKRARKDEAEESEISDDNSDVGSIDEVETSEPESEEEIQETAAEKRVRLAKAYLDKVQAGLEG